MFSNPNYSRLEEIEKGIDFSHIEDVSRHNQYKVLNSFQKYKVSETHFTGSTGYGYNDLGREVIDLIYADSFGYEKALVRQNIVSGTHAIVTALLGILGPGDEMLSISGTPYDTLKKVIGSFERFNIIYNQIELLKDGEFDYDGIKKSIKKNTKLIFIQRSKGYSFRPSITVGKINEAIEFIKGINKNTICMVDNCYGEFVEKTEPNADIIAGSLIKNPGGGLAKTGGYIAGRSDLVELAADRLTVPGMGFEIGATNFNREFLHGFFLAPEITKQSLKTAILAGTIFNWLEFEVSPAPDEIRTDIVQAIKFRDKTKLLRFCESIQAMSPVDSFITPVPWAMPGYSHEVVMAAGAFVQGASIELSADAPIKEPFIAYIQGGLVYNHSRLAVFNAALNILGL